MMDRFLCWSSKPSTPGCHVSEVPTFPNGANRPAEFEPHGCCTCPTPLPKANGECGICRRLIVSQPQESTP